MSGKYWSRVKKYSRAERAVLLHFTRHPEDLIIRVARTNQPAHDIIIVPPGASDAEQYRLVRDYVRHLSRDDLRHLTTTN